MGFYFQPFTIQHRSELRSQSLWNRIVCPAGVSLALDPFSLHTPTSSNHTLAWCLFLIRSLLKLPLTKFTILYSIYSLFLRVAALYFEPLKQYEGSAQDEDPSFYYSNLGLILNQLNTMPYGYCSASVFSPILHTFIQLTTTGTQKTGPIGSAN